MKIQTRKSKGSVDFQNFEAPKVQWKFGEDSEIPEALNAHICETKY